MYIVGIIIVIVLHTFFYYDQVENNKDAYEAHRKIFNFILMSFFLAEIFVFSLIYNFVFSFFAGQ